MKTVSKSLFALILLSSASTAVASPESGGRTIAQIAAPDVSSWSEVDEGLYQGLGRQGETVIVYAGAPGMALLLAERQRELDEVRAEMHEMAREGDIDIEYALTQRKRIEDLKLAIAHLEDFLAETSESEISIDASQSFSLAAPQVCNYIMYGDSTFVANYNLNVQPIVSATFNPFGSGAQFGPVGLLPFHAFRSVFVKVQNATNSASSTDLNASVSASQSTLTFGGSCNMETTHTVSAHCSVNSPPTGWAVTRRQTCAGVINGTPPF